MSPRLGSPLCHSPLYRTKHNFCKSCTKQHWTVQQNFHINEELHVPQMLYQLSYIPNREKYNELCKVCQVILPLVKGTGSLSASVRYLTAVSNASNAADMATAARHTDTIQPAQPSWPKHLSLTLYLEAPLILKYLSLTAFHFYIFGYNFLRYTLLKPGNSLPLPWDTMLPHCQG